MTLKAKLKDLKNEGFNEMTHAFIAAKYYVYLTEVFGERGKRPLSMQLNTMLKPGEENGPKGHPGRPGTDL